MVFLRVRGGTLLSRVSNTGDGRPDLTNHYDARQRVSRREEDTDHDGAVDVISHFEDGRLARRELLGGPDAARP